jgi:hypothetical protein
MQKALVSTGALVLGLAIGSGTALAQNMQGPAASNFGLTSNPQSSAQPLYNYAPAEGTRARHRTRHTIGGDRR